MNNIKEYILEKLVLNKNVQNEEEYQIIYGSTAISTVNNLLETIMKRTTINKVNAKISSKDGLMTWYDIIVETKQDYLKLLVWIYDRVSNYRDIREDFDNRMKSTLKNYTKNYKSKIHSLYTMDEIYDAYIKYQKFNNV